MDWCYQSKRTPMPAKPETILAYLKAIEEHGQISVSTVSVKLAAIQHAHHTANLISPLADPRVQEVWAGFRREHAVPSKRCLALTTAQIKKMLEECPPDVGGDRDAALLLVGFCGGLRRSELAALNVEDIRWMDKGAVLTLRRTKTDQEGRGRVVAIPYLTPASCPARHLKAYLKRAEFTSGAVFRPVTRSGKTWKSDRLHPDSICRIVKRYATYAGLDGANYSGHSLRAGFVTSARANGADVVEIAQSTGHQDMSTLRAYIRHQDPFQECAAFKLGL